MLSSTETHEGPGSWLTSKDVRPVSTALRPPWRPYSSAVQQRGLCSLDPEPMHELHQTAFRYRSESSCHHSMKLCAVHLDKISET